MKSTIFLFLSAYYIGVSGGFVVNPTFEIHRHLLQPSRLSSSKQDADEDTYHKGGNAKFQNPVVQPAKLGVEESEEECEHIMIDFATGDELCWGEEPTHPRNVVAESKKGDWVSESYNNVDFDVAKNYHKGGNARVSSESRLPTKLEEECETPFIDFVSGDELCWNDYQE